MVPSKYMIQSLFPSQFAQTPHKIYSSYSYFVAITSICGDRVFTEVFLERGTLQHQEPQGGENAKNLDQNIDSCSFLPKTLFSNVS